MAALEDLTRHPGVQQLLTLAERVCVYACCGIDAFDGEESTWDETTRALYAETLEAGHAASLVVALDQVLAVLVRDGYLDSGQLNGTIVLESPEGQGVLEYLRRARERAASVATACEQ